MRNMVVFGNCQGYKLKELLSAVLPASEFDISYFSNNIKSGYMKPNQEILSEIGECDILIYQPLSDSHGELCDENIRKIIKSKCKVISFPYIFNSGTYSLSHAPCYNGHRYGFIFGEEVIIDLLKSGKSKEDIIHDYRKGAIDFNLTARFNKCLTEMKRRELSTDIKLSEFISHNYNKAKFFITHNHPSNIVFHEMIRQIMTIVPLPIDQSKIQKSAIPDLPETTCPITPHDITTHSYQFKTHEDWFIKGSSLIELIADNYWIESIKPEPTSENKIFQPLEP
ncbi:MAG: hypothetical protein OMM_04122 [Candidatus Magnetoglobus multicellularis str. Araruama]|uniref:Polysaccharide biosynthesis enzyme WcbI domain-containing protein n=1 Tax=Candidatus Magnetoglobus multicellularis str. Araruama TaxID=890399 RepID=A0A1V1P2W4_9BACT|nr:MAG: hypothetical protein OMM_04122 [Candidatus Magnetoglobus multicellularis str. Araruama]